MKYIRKEFLHKKQVALMTDLTSHFVRIMNEKGFTVERSTKKKLKKKLKMSFVLLQLYLKTMKEGWYFWYLDLSRDDLVIKVMEL